MALETEDLQAIAQMIATATTEALKPIYSAMAEKKEAEVKASRLEKIKSGEIEAETEEEKEVVFKGQMERFRRNLIAQGKVAPADAKERKIWRDNMGYEYDGKIKL